MPSFLKVARTGEIPPGSARVFQVKDRRLLICHVEEGGFFAVDDLCTHDGGDLGAGELDGYAIECPRHGARFDVRSGRVLALPAVQPIGTYEVRVEGEDILVALD
jgi:3-phenylpropionate/trans-cinnamate dioxygenase ferredoxin subunit